MTVTDAIEDMENDDDDDLDNVENKDKLRVVVEVFCHKMKQERAFCKSTANLTYIFDPAMNRVIQLKLTLKPNNLFKTQLFNQIV